MAKSKQASFHPLRLMTVVIMVVFLGALAVVWSGVKQKQAENSSYLVYQNPQFGFSIGYPQNWEIREDTQAFENGDVVSFNTTGAGQKARTELTDGARLSIAVPFEIDTDLKSWLKANYSSKANFSQITFGGTTFEQVDECYIGCLTYFYTIREGKVFGIATIAAGDDSIKMVYDNALLTMLKSFKFTDSAGNLVTEAEAISKVRLLPEVADYLKRVPNGNVAVNGGEDDAYMVQVFEIKDEHTATFNWYRVDKASGETKKEF